LTTPHKPASPSDQVFTGVSSTMVCWNLVGSCLQKRSKCLILRSGSRFHTSLPTLEKEKVAIDKKSAALAKAAAEYNCRKAVYKRQVSALRRKYAYELDLQRTADEAERVAQEKKERRRKLERQRLKNIKAARSSIQQLEIQREREKQFQEELRTTQMKRDSQKDLFRKARQLVVDEFEEEAPLWLTTHEEVEKVFTHETQQELWSFPNSVIGAPRPTEDSKYWNFEAHTWYLDMTYKTQEEYLTENVLEEAYNSANIDEFYWTTERLDERRKLEDKAKLRAMVKDAGRRSLLLKQKELLQDTFPDEQCERSVNIPRPMPVPNVRILANEEVMEQEGVKALFKDPTQFFEFENQSSEDSTRTTDENGSYEGPTLGAPISLRNDVMTEKRLNKPYPVVLGKLLKPDTRTAKEKKRDERKRAMLVAAQESTDLLDIDEGEGGDFYEEELKEEQEWAKGFDPEKDKNLIDIPPRDRYIEEDLDKIIIKLERKEHFLKSALDTELRTVHDKFKSNIIMNEEESGDIDGLNIRAGGKLYDPESIGIDTIELKKLLESLTDEQMVELLVIDHAVDKSMDSSELEEKLKEVPSLSTDQIESFLRIEKTLVSSDVLATARELDPSDFPLKAVK